MYSVLFIIHVSYIIPIDVNSACPISKHDCEVGSTVFHKERD